MYMLKKGTNIRRTASTDRRDALVKLGWQEVSMAKKSKYEEQKEPESEKDQIFDLRNMVKEDLLTHAKKIGLTVPMGIKKDDLLAMLEAHDAKG